jgi:hypothetical protein
VYHAIFRHMRVGLERSRPANPKAFCPSTALCPPAGQRGLWRKVVFTSGPNRRRLGEIHACDNRLSLMRYYLFTGPHRATTARLASLEPAYKRHLCSRRLLSRGDGNATHYALALFCQRSVIASLTVFDQNTERQQFVLLQAGTDPVGKVEMRRRLALRGKYHDRHRSHLRE